MYNYTNFDKDFVAERAVQFRDQVQRRIDGSLPKLVRLKQKRDVHDRARF
jgi:hypothetical protein